MKSYHVPSSNCTVNHLMFADDMFLFTNGGKGSLSYLKKILGDYEAVSGQHMNAEKSSFIPSSKRDMTYSEKIHEVTGFRASSFPIKYLGVPLFKGKGRAVYFEGLIAQVRSRLAGWKTKLLSTGGKLTLIKSVLSSIPIYTLAILPVPKSVHYELDRLYAKFLWNDKDSNRHHWVAWDKICRPLSYGGLNIRRTCDMAESL